MTCRYNRALTRLNWLLPLLFCSPAFSQNGALRVTDPVPSKDGTIVTKDSAISLRGTLSYTGGDMRVLWESSRGFSDLATVTLADDGRTVQWRSTAPVPLRVGNNHVRIKALGQPSASAFVNIFYAPDTTAPQAPLGTQILHGKPITYELKDGLAIYQGDLILGNAADVAAGRFAGRLALGNAKGVPRQTRQPSRPILLLPPDSGRW